MEDGTIQGLLELLRALHLGAGVLASAVGMDKAIMKLVWRMACRCAPIASSFGTSARPSPTPRWTCSRQLGYPMFVQAANLGSSVGISRPRPAPTSPARWIWRGHSIAKSWSRPRSRGAEIECAVLGNDAPEASVAGE